MTRVLHTARISNVEIIKFVVNNKDESLVAQLVRAPNRYLGGHGFDSRRGLRIFLCPMLVSLLKKIISNLKISCHRYDKIPRDKRLCSLCKYKKIEDETHFSYSPKRDR